jgi:histidinol-phosphatase (PHP family)
VALYDQHQHTRFSTDSETEPAANVERALQIGLSGVTFTDHFDTNPQEWPVCRYDYEAIARAVGELRERFGSRIRVGQGIEVCYQPEQMGRTLEFVEARRFDVVLLSVHWTQGRAMHLREQWEDWDTAQSTRNYLQTVLEAVRFVEELARQGRRPFDVLGHLDMVKRYTLRFKGGYDLSGCRDLIDEILAGCVRSGLIPELNTSSWRQGLTEPMPADWIVRRYADLGGKAMSLGSDAHRAEDVGADFDRAARLLKDNGIPRIAVFANRSMELIPI